MSKYMTVSELIKVLSKMQAEHGDLEISVNTQEGSSYSLYSEVDVQLAHYYDKFGTEIQMIEIG
jgi:hypothetical protein